MYTCKRFAISLALAAALASFSCTGGGSRQPKAPTVEFGNLQSDGGLELTIEAPDLGAEAASARLARIEPQYLVAFEPRDREQPVQADIVAAGAPIQYSGEQLSPFSELSVWESVCHPCRNAAGCGGGLRDFAIIGPFAECTAATLRVCPLLRICSVELEDGRRVPGCFTDAERKECEPIEGLPAVCEQRPGQAAPASAFIPMDCSFTAMAGFDVLEGGLVDPAPEILVDRPVIRFGPEGRPGAQP